MKAMPTEQDDQLLHDIAVPRYSAIGTVTPNRIVLVGVYLIFVPGLVYCVLMVPEALFFSGLPVAACVMIGVGYLFGAGVCFLIVYKTHKRYRAAKRAAAGLCGVCGYDLRASGDRCPECGTVVSGR
jgi:hypothetical protein